MVTTDFCQDFNSSVERSDIRSATMSLMRELGNILVHQKNDFVHLLNESGVPASVGDSETILINKFVDNISDNPKLMLGASLLANHHNRQIGFDGSSELSDDGVKNGYFVIQEFFGDRYSYTNGDTGPIGASTLKGGATGGTAGLVIGAIGDIAKATTKVSEGQQKKKYGGMDYLSKKQDSKTAIVQAVMAQRQAQIDAAKKTQEDKSKTRRLTYIVGGSVLGAALIVTLVLVLKNKRK
jgi:hypothetical protein